MTLSKGKASSWSGGARVVALAMGSLALLSSPALADAVKPKPTPKPVPLCTLDTKSFTAKKLGTRQSLVKGGVHSQDELSRMWTDHADEIACLLDAGGLGDLKDPLREAAGSGSATTRPLSSTECFEWMARRDRKKGVLASPTCLDTEPKGKRMKPAVYEAFEIPVRTEAMISETKPDPRCEITASGDLKELKIDVSIAGSGNGAKTTWTRTDGQQGELTGGPSWEVPWTCPDLCKNDTTFTVTASDQGTQTWAINTNTFVVPQVCGNLSYKGKTSREETRPGQTAQCAKSATVPKTMPPPPTVTLAVAPGEVRSCRPFDNVDVKTGSICSVAVVTQLYDPKGKHLPGYDEALKNLPSNSFAICGSGLGTFTLKSTATDACGQEATAEALVLVKARWTLRGFGAWVDPKDDAIHTERTLAGNTRESTSYNLKKGAGVGGSAEYHFNDRVGLEGGLLLGRVDTLFMKDLGAGWAMQTKNVTFTSLTFGPNFHFLGATPGRPDLYLGPFVSWWNFEGKTYTPIGAADKRSLESTFGVGLQLGYDLPFHRSTQWALHLGARYEKLSPDLKVTTGGKIGLDVDPLILAAGVAYSF